MGAWREARGAALLICAVVMTGCDGCEGADAEREARPTSEIATPASTGQGDPASSEGDAPEDPWALSPPAAGGRREPFEVVPQEVFREYGVPFEIAPSGELAIGLGERGRIILLDLGAAKVRASRRIFRISQDWSFGFDVTGEALYARNYSELCAWDLRQEEPRCVDTSRHGDVAIQSPPVAFRRARHVFFLSQRHLRAGAEDAHPIELSRWTLGHSRVLPVVPLEGLEAPLYDIRARLAVHPRRPLVWIGADRKAFLVDAVARTVVGTFDEEGPTEGRWGPRGRSLATYSGSTLTLRDPRTGEPRHRLSLPSPIDHMVFREDEETLALCLEHGKALEVDVERGAFGAPMVDTGCDRESATLVSDDRGMRVVQQSSVDFETIDDRRWVVITTDGGNHRRKLLAEYGEHSLWELELFDRGAITRRRGGAERFGIDGMRALRVEPSDDVGEGELLEHSYRDGYLVGRSPSGDLAVWVDEENETVVLSRSDGSRVPIEEPLDLRCYVDEWEACTAGVAFDADETLFAIVEPSRVAIYDTENAERRVLIPTGRQCRPACEGRDAVCFEGECMEMAMIGVYGAVEIGPEAERLIATSARGGAHLYTVDGERLVRLGSPTDGPVALLHQVQAFSPDGSRLAFARRRRIQIRNARDGSEIATYTLPRPLRFVRFDDEGENVIGLSTGHQLLVLDASDGSEVETRDLSGFRGVDPDRKLVALCREGLLHLMRLSSGAERGPLGRCPPIGRFVFGATDRFVGYVHGTLARVHRARDGEVINLRSVRRPGHPPMMLAFTDSGLFEAENARPAHLVIREGSPLDGELESIVDDPRERPGLVSAFFAGASLVEASEAP